MIRAKSWKIDCSVFWGPPGITRSQTWDQHSRSITVWFHSVSSISHHEFSLQQRQIQSLMFSWESLIQILTAQSRWDLNIIPTITPIIHQQAWDGDYTAKIWIFMTLTFWVVVRNVEGFLSHAWWRKYIIT